MKRLLTAAALGVGGFAATVAGASGASAATPDNDLVDADDVVTAQEDLVDAHDLDVVDLDAPLVQGPLLTDPLVQVNGNDGNTILPVHLENLTDSINVLSEFNPAR